MGRGGLIFLLNLLELPGVLGDSSSVQNVTFGVCTFPNILQFIAFLPEHMCLLLFSCVVGC